MGAGAHIAIITVLVIVIGIFLLLVARGFNPPSNGWTPPPDPELKYYIQNVQQASTALYNETQALTSLIAGLSGDISTTFASYDSDEGVSDGSASAIRKGVDTAVSTAASKLKDYADGVSLFNKTVQAWTTSTTPYKLMGQKSAADALQVDVLNPMAEFLNLEGQLSSFVSVWNSSYEAASQGGKCSHSSDCSKYHQSCVSGRCAATMNGTMQGAINSLSSAASTLSTQGALTTSPYRTMANTVNSAYIVLFNHLAGLG